jgi:hypothetical protein
MQRGTLSRVALIADASAHALRRLRLQVRSRRELIALGCAALLAAGCGGAEANGGAARAGGDKAGRIARQLGPRYGIAAILPAGWNGRLGRGALHASSFPLPVDAPGWMREAAIRLAPGDALVTIFENEPRDDAPPELFEYPELDGPLRLDADAFQPFDGITEDSRSTGHGYARRTFQVSRRFFVLFAVTGERVPSPSVLADLNGLLGSFRVESGDFLPGTVEAGRFPKRTGWFVGSSGEDEARVEGEFTTAWASTIPYADDWNALPPFETLRRLPRDGIVIWLGLSRSNRFPPRREGNADFPAREPPFSLDEFERRAGWEGQIRDLPAYVLWGTARGQYQLDLRVYFGRPDPTEAMLAEAQAMLDGLELPDWGPWETG